MRMVNYKHPSKHYTLNNQYWIDIGPASATLAQHSPSIGTTCGVFWRQHDCWAGLTWLVHAQRLALLVPAELAPGACFHRYVTVLALGAGTAQVATVTQAAQEKFLKKADS